MNFPRKFITFAIIFSVAIVIYAGYKSGLFPVKELLDRINSVAGSQKSPRPAPVETTLSANPDTTSQNGPDAQTNQTSVQEGTEEKPNIAKLDFEELQKTLSIVDQKQRNTLLGDAEKFRNFVMNEAANKSVFAAAHANRIDQNENNLLIAHRGADNILREIYLKQLIASKIPADFPTDDQIKTYFEKNKEKFVLEERMPVWQIFLPVSSDLSQKEIENLKKKAESIITDINKNRIDFATAAIRYSGHKESKFNGGFMGVAKISDMKPVIKKVLMSLPPDTVSSPISTDEGLHILKHGPQIASYELQLEDVREQIKTLLIKQARNEIRQAIFKQASTTYPVAIDDHLIEAWRLKLKPVPAPETVTE